MPHWFPKHVPAHVVFATSPTFERYLSIGANRVQVQHRGGVPNYPSTCLRFWWCLHLAVELKLILECPDHATHQSNCSPSQPISSVIVSKVVTDPCPSCISCFCGNLHHCSFSIAAYGHLCQAKRAHPLCRLVNCIRVRCSLSTGSTKTGVASSLRKP